MAGCVQLNARAIGQCNELVVLSNKMPLRLPAG